LCRNLVKSTYAPCKLTDQDSDLSEITADQKSVRVLWDRQERGYIFIGLLLLAPPYLSKVAAVEIAAVADPLFGTQRAHADRTTAVQPVVPVVRRDGSEEAVWNYTVYSKNGQRLLHEEIAKFGRLTSATCRVCPNADDSDVGVLETHIRLPLKNFTN
jgi:hypothetical protein